MIFLVSVWYGLRDDLKSIEYFYFLEELVKNCYSLRCWKNLSLKSFSLGIFFVEGFLNTD